MKYKLIMYITYFNYKKIHTFKKHKLIQTNFNNLKSFGYTLFSNTFMKHLYSINRKNNSKNDNDREEIDSVCNCSDGFDLGGIVRGLKLKSSRLQTSYFFVQKLKIFIEDLNYMLKLY